MVCTGLVWFGVAVGLARFGCEIGLVVKQGQVMLTDVNCNLIDNQDHKTSKAFNLQFSS